MAHPSVRIEDRIFVIAGNRTQAVWFVEKKLGKHPARLVYVDRRELLQGYRLPGLVLWVVDSVNLPKNLQELLEVARAHGFEIRGGTT